MRNVVLKIIVFFLLVSVSGITTSETNIAGDEVKKHRKLESHLILNLFLDAVERDGLTVFEQNITRSMIKPAQVAYIYDIEKDELTISIYSKLKSPIMIPHYDEKFYVDAVSVIVGETGDIEIVKAHVLPQQE